MSDIVGKQIKKRRKELSLSQLQLAELCGYKTKGSISRIEKGETSLNQTQIMEFAKILRTSPSYIMGWVDDPNYSPSKETSISVSIGNQLEELEKSHHYSEEFVAESIGIPIEYYRVMKRGENRVFDSNLMLKFSSFYHKRWTDFFPSNIQMPSISDNICALQVMSGRTDEEICNYLGISQDTYLSIVSGKKKIDYELLEKFNSFYNMTFSSLLGTDFSAYTGDPKKRLSVKMQAYLNDIYDALDGEEFNVNDMAELIDYIKYMAKSKKIKRMRGK